MGKLLDFIENVARYMKARHYGELMIFGLSLVLMILALIITLSSTRGAENLSGLEESIKYMIAWISLLSAHLLIVTVTITVLIKAWGNRRLILIGLFFQGISLLILMTHLPLR